MISRVSYKLKLNVYKGKVKFKSTIRELNLFGMGWNTPETLLIIEKQTTNSLFIIKKVKPHTIST